MGEGAFRMGRRRRGANAILMEIPCEVAFRTRRQVRALVINRRGSRVAALIVAAMLASLGACSAGSPAPVGSGEQAPGTFNVQLHGEMTNAIGTARP